jgi:RHS repeat-associated protein
MENTSLNTKNTPVGSVKPSFINRTNFIWIAMIASLFVLCIHWITPGVHEPVATPMFSGQLPLLAENRQPDRMYHHTGGNIADENTATEEPVLIHIYRAGNQEGFIGVFSDKPIDNPVDNLFHVYIEKELKGNELVWLEYDLYGVEDYTGISRGINERLSVGGYITRKSQSWKRQREQLNPADLRQGNNVIRFTLPDGIDHGYRVRDLAIWVEPADHQNRSDRRLVVNQPVSEYYYGKLGYIQGYISGDTQHTAQVFINGEKILYHQGSFESLVEKPETSGKTWMAKVEAVFEDGGILSMEVPFSQPVDWHLQADFDPQIHHAAQWVKPGEEISVGIGTLHLRGSAESVSAPVNITATALRERDVPALDAGMINVTAGFHGYRLLPHGTQFLQQVNLELGFDTLKIPEGYSIEDIRTYYFCEDNHHWVALPRDTVLWASASLVSHTDHFTDFINAIIKVPESPETQGYTPTHMSGIQAANPAAGINLMNPPSAHSMGTANLSYPLNIPAGRQGMQPQLAISYNSGGGNGWMGLGWDLSIPSISVETRWGVPRYDPDMESETYLMMGEQLAPLAHKSDWVPRTSEKRFYPRIEGSFSKIERKNTSPKTYYWVVTDKSGIKYYYGGVDVVDDNAVLKDQSNNIAFWALVKVEDLHGNYVTYTYARVEDVGLEHGTVPGYELYIKSIEYTGYRQEKGAYSIHFTRDREQAGFESKKRKDVTINARYGFKQVTADLLKQIVVKFKADTIRSYDLHYSEGAFHKTLLDSIVEKDSEGKRFYAHKLEYYDEVRKGNVYMPFEDLKTLELIQPKVSEHKLMPWAKVNAIGGSKSNTLGGGSYVGLGWAGSVFSKQSSAGLDYNYTRSVNEGLKVMVDIDGDGLIDIVYVHDGKLKFMKRLPDGLGFDPTQREITGPFSTFQLTKTRSHQIGIGVYPGLNSYIGGSKSFTTAETSIYFTDANNDGLIDIVMNGAVYFNRLEAGQPTFLPTTTGTPNPIEKRGDVSPQLNFNTLTDAEVLELKRRNPLQDAVRMWIAPHAGHIRINAPIHLAEIKSEHSNKDGVKVSIQHGSKILWYRTIDAKNYHTILPDSVENIQVNKDDVLFFRVHSIDNGNDDIVLWNPEITYVDKDLNFVDPDDNAYYAYKAGDDFLLSGKYTLSTPFHGIARIYSEFKKPVLSDDIEVIITRKNSTLGVDTLWHTFHAWHAEVDTIIEIPSMEISEDDEVSFMIYSSSNVKWNDISWNPYLYYTQSLSEDIPSVVDEDGNYLYYAYPVANHTLYPYLLNMGKVFQVPVIVDTLSVYPVLNETASGEKGFFDLAVLNEEGEIVHQKQFELKNGKLIPETPIVFACASNTTISFLYNPLRDLSDNFHLTDVSITSDNPLVEPIEHPVSEVFEYNPFVKITAWGGVDTLQNPFYKPKGSMWFTVKQKNKLIAKEKRNYNNGIDSLTFQASSGEILYFEYFLESGDLIPCLVDSIQIDVAKETYYEKAFIHSILTDTIMHQYGHMYRGWGQFGYNANEGRGELPIDVRKLSITGDIDKKAENKEIKPKDIEGSKDMDELENRFSDAGGYNASTSVFVLMRPDALHQRWMGYDDFVYVTADTLSSSRMGEKEITSGGALSVEKDKFFAPVKKNKSTTSGASGNLMGIVGSTASNTNSIMISDFMDMNGDGFPDIIAGGVVQFTNSQGGLSIKTLDMDSITHTKAKAYGANVNGGAIHAMTRSVSKKHDSTLEENKPKKSAGAGATHNTEEDYFTYLDINGDGLPDKVFRNGYVSLNMGYSFGTKEYWNFNDVQKTKTSLVDMSAGYGSVSVGIEIDPTTGELRGGSFQYQRDNGSFVAGIGAHSSSNTPEILFMDVNGDGLPDQVSYLNSSVEVRLNNGNGFEKDLIVWKSNDPISKTVNLTGSFNAAGTFGFPLFVIPKIVFNPRYNLSGSVSREEKRFMDFTCDGNLDYVVSHGPTNMKLYRSTIGRTNLLKKVTRPMNAYFELAYEQTGNTYDMPQAMWTLSQVKIFDGHTGDGIDTLVSRFEYANGYRDRQERVFYGFETVKTHQLDEKGKIYRSVVNTYENRNYYTKGALLSEIMMDSQGNKYTENINTYVLKPGKDADGKVLNHVFFPALIQTDKHFYERKNEPQKSTRVSFVYDDYGNVKEYTNHGDLEWAGDNLTAKIGYWNVADKNIVSIPKSIVVTDNKNNTMRQRETTIDNNTGKIKTIRQKLDNQWAVVDLFYDKYGNLDSVLRPANYKGQRMHLAYEYDTVVHSFVTRVRDAFGYSSSMSYDYRFGQVLSTTDINNQQTLYQLDKLGRIKKIQGPYEIASGQEFTIEFDYYPHAPIPWAHTKHYDPEYPGNFMETALFTDGLGRVLQTKKDTELYPTRRGNGHNDARVVSGKVLYDAFGRAVESYYPVVDKKPEIKDFETAVDTVPPTRIVYDILDRTTYTFLPDDSRIIYEYGFDKDRQDKLQFMTQITDPNGLITQQFTDIRGRQTAVKAPGDTWTSFVYNAIDELVEATDDLGNTTLSQYDMLGRRTLRNHPDAGINEYKYDLSGNLISQMTPNLRAKGKPIVYEYDYNRPLAIVYPENTINNVRYEYGAPGAEHNRAGRISVLEDATGAQEFFYGPLGEVVKNIRTIVVPDDDIYTFETQWEYDTWNRLKKLTYPDGEEVFYAYNRGGMLKSMYGKKKGHRYDYLTQLGYDKFGDRVFLSYGNGTQTTYEYDQRRRRLQNISAHTSTGRQMMDHTFSYDAVGNITQLQSNAPIPQEGLKGGNFTYEYQYDHLYRLTGAEGSYRGATHEHRYTLAMSYGSTGAIQHKDQQHQFRGYDDPEWAPRHKTTYTWDYEYNSKQPHAPSKIGELTYTYDANGNPTGWQSTENNQRRQILWDEENRMRAIANNGVTHHYMYDASGERVIKSTGDGQTIYIDGFPMGGSGVAGNYTMYVNPFMVVNNMKFTKHYYAGSQRIVSKLGEMGSHQDMLNPRQMKRAGGSTILWDNKELRHKEQLIANFKELGLDGILFTAGKSGKTPYGRIKKYFRDGGQLPGEGSDSLSTGKVERLLFFYHPDHLGSSSSITDASGEVYQHVQYFPFGETFVEERTGTQYTPYLYNGKELDEETGLYYYGARYYDPRISMFYGVDVLAEHPNQTDKSPYIYTWNNPINLSDPDGNFPDGEISFGLTYGTGGLKANINLTFNQGIGDFTASYGLGMTLHTNFYTTGKSGMEFRNSFMINYDDGKTGGSLSTNLWNGTGMMREFNQRTGKATFRSGDFNFSYENDGTPFQWIGLGDGGDSYRTAAASIGIGEFSLNMNLITGLRNKTSYALENALLGGSIGIPQGRGQFGENYKHGFVVEQNTPYRYGGLTANYGGLSLGVNSEWIRHGFQNVLAHHIIQPQRQFPMQSNDWKPVVNFSNQGVSKFTIWGQ